VGSLSSPSAQTWKAAFGARVRELRQERGLSQEAFADSAGFHRTYIGAIERGEQNPSLAVIHLIATALDVHVRELFVD